MKSMGSASCSASRTSSSASSWSPRRESNACLDRPPPELGVEIVGDGDGAARFGECERLVVAAELEQHVAEHRVDARPYAQISDLEQYIVSAAEHPLRALEVADDLLGKPDVYRVEAFEQRELVLLDERPGVRARAPCLVDVPLHRLEQGAHLQRMGLVRSARHRALDERRAELDSLARRRRAPRHRPERRDQRCAFELSIAGTTRDLRRPSEVDLTFRPVPELEAAHAGPGVGAREVR